MHSYDKCEGRIRIEHANEKCHRTKRKNLLNFFCASFHVCTSHLNVRHLSAKN